MHNPYREIEPHIHTSPAVCYFQTFDGIKEVKKEKMQTICQSAYIWALFTHYTCVNVLEPVHAISTGNLLVYI